MRVKSRFMTIGERARSVLIGILVAGACVAAQAAERERFTPVAADGKITAHVAPRSLDTTPVLVVAFLGGESVADVQLRTGRELSRSEKNVVKAQRRAEQAAPRVAHRGRGWSRRRQLPERAERHQGTHTAESHLGTAQDPRRSRRETSRTSSRAENFLGVQRVQAPYRLVRLAAASMARTSRSRSSTRASTTPTPPSAAPVRPRPYDCRIRDFDRTGESGAVRPGCTQGQGRNRSRRRCITTRTMTRSGPRTRSAIRSTAMATARTWPARPPGSACSLTERHTAGPYDQTTHDNAFKVGPGVAPRADLYAVRVFGCAGSTGVVPEALEWAVDNDMDVVNMSLGSSFGTADDASAEATDNAVDAGISVVTSAGNAGLIDYVTGSPGIGLAGDLRPPRRPRSASSAPSTSTPSPVGQRHQRERRRLDEPADGSRCTCCALRQAA